MKVFFKQFKLTLIICFVFSIAFSQKQEKVKVEYFETIPSIQIRALEVVSDSIIWFAAYRGVYGYTEDAGKHWHIDSVENNSNLNFRSMAVLNDSTVLMLSIASPALLYKTTNKGKSWKIVYQNKHPDAFFDCMKFKDSKNGYALGDPIDGCMQLIETNDAGESWKSIDCNTLPKLEIGEAFFATSNSNMDFQMSHFWIATGGKKSRIWYSKNNCKNWESYKIPLPENEQMSGVFSMDFYNEKLGAIAGGNYEKKDSILNCFAITNDAGKTWQNIQTHKAMFGSCVQFRTQEDIYFTGHSGSLHYNCVTKKINYLIDQHMQELKFHTLRISPSKETIWFAGTKGRIAKINL